MAPLRVRSASPVAAIGALLIAFALAPASVAAAPRTPGRHAGQPPPVVEAPSWQQVLRRAAEAGPQRRYRGEVLWIVWTDGQPHVHASRTHRSRTELTVSSAERYTLRLGADGGDMVDHQQGWRIPLPAADLAVDDDGLAAIAEKYDVTVTGQERLLDRPSIALEMRRRSDGSLREQLWFDEVTGLLLRRQTYEGADRPLRLVTYLSLDLDPGSFRRTERQETRPEHQSPLEERPHTVTALDDNELQALRHAGWVIPEALSGGYHPVGAYVVEGSDSQPLQVVYGDGVYTVSLFQQRGTPDWSSLPEGAQRARHVDGRAYEWPGAVPQRLVWEAWGTTFSLVGDAPPEELAAMVASLPAPETVGMADRLRRKLRNLWSWVSP